MKTQVVEVVYGDGLKSSKTYSYVGNGNLRTGQHIANAPVNHYKTGTPFSAPVTVVATHRVEGVKVGDFIGVTGNSVHTIGKPLKYLPSNKALKNDDYVAQLGGEQTQAYMQQFNPREQLLSGRAVTDTTQARNQLLGV